MEEYFDVLNEKGEYLNKIETREKCHKEGLWHKAIVVFIINSKGQVLLQRRSKTKKMWPDMWDITSGGHVLAGEFGFEAGIREAKEELGVDIARENMTFIGSVISTNIKGDIVDNHFNEYYVVIQDLDESKLVLQEEEVSEVKWMDKEVIIDKIKNNYNGITNKQGCWDYLVKYYEWLENKAI
jgi:isopentenyl-diphosphate delta-isomerase type 1